MTDSYNILYPEYNSKCKNKNIERVLIDCDNLKSKIDVSSIRYQGKNRHRYDPYYSPIHNKHIHSDAIKYFKSVVIPKNIKIVEWDNVSSICNIYGDIHDPRLKYNDIYPEMRWCCSDKCCLFDLDDLNEFVQYNDADIVLKKLKNSRLSYNIKNEIEHYLISCRGVLREEFN